jgi:hypothetical protein
VCDRGVDKWAKGDLDGGRRRLQPRARIAHIASLNCRLLTSVRHGTHFAELDAIPLTRCRCLILAANGLSVMFFAWMIRDGSNGLR